MPFDFCGFLENFKALRYLCVEKNILMPFLNLRNAFREKSERRFYLVYRVVAPAAYTDTDDRCDALPSEANLPLIFLSPRGFGQRNASRGSISVSPPATL